MFVLSTINDAPGDALQKLSSQFDVRLYAGKDRPTRKELLREVKGASAIWCELEDKIDREVIDAAGPTLRIIANYAVGFDNIDVKYANSKGIVVTNTPNVLTQAVAEHTFALLMAAARRICESDANIRKGIFPHWGAIVEIGTQLRGKTIGIVGAGRIGGEVARIAAHGFKMKILYYNRSKDLDLEKETGAKYVNLDYLLKESDFISVHVPLTPETNGMFGSSQFKKMKKTAIFVNTARGKIVREAELANALKTKTIAAAALDVFENEPNVNSVLQKLPNVVMTPHIASATLEARTAMADLGVENITLVLNGKKAKTEVKV